MTSLVKRTSKKSNGFTLVELIVVLVILGVLAAILVPNMLGWIGKSKEYRLISMCRTCVTSAQTLLYEDYKTKSNEHLYPPFSEDVLTLAGIDQGSVLGIILEENPTKGNEKQPIIEQLTYKDETGLLVTFLKEPTPHYEFGSCEQFDKGISYKVGDIMNSNGYVFKCLRAHTSGTTSRTRDPSTRSNKSTWEVIGFYDGTLEYSSTVRYAVGLKVPYEGRVYARKDFNLVGGQNPEYNPPRDSDYWLLLD